MTAAKRSQQTRAEAPLIRRVTAGDWAYSAQWRPWVVALVVIVAAVVFAPTLRNGFLLIAFDDQMVIDDPDIQALDRAHLSAIVTASRGGHFIPLSSLWLAVQYRLWGKSPLGYHATNVLLHAAVAGSLVVFSWPLLRSSWASTLAALTFAVHPLQLEAVTLAVQAKTLLSALLLLWATIAYQRWRATDRNAYYALALLLAVAAVAAKPLAVVVPVLFALYDYAFVDGRLHVPNKLPFVAVAAASSLATIAAGERVGALTPPHGGNWLAHYLVVGRVTAEYFADLFLPIALSPIYYYPRAIVYAPLTIGAAAVLLAASVFIVLRRRSHPWTFFCFAWFAVALAPQSNIVPLAQLRPDRYLYLSMIGFGIWIAVVLDRTRSLGPGPCRIEKRGRWLGVALLLFFASLTVSNARFWRDDISAWQRIVWKHDRAALPRVHLASAYRDAGLPARAEQTLLEARRVDPDLPQVHWGLATLYARHGKRDAATAAVRRFLELKPGDPEGSALLRRLTGEGAAENGKPGADAPESPSSVAW